jgi:WD40 repeat protein
LVAFSPDGKKVLSVSQGVVVLMDVETGKWSGQIVPMNQTTRVAASPVAPVVAIAQLASVRPLKIELTVYDYSKQDGPTIPLTLVPAALAFSRDGSALALATSDGPVQVFDTRTWQVKATLQKQRQKDNSFLMYDRIGLSPNGSLVWGRPVGQGRPKGEVWPVGADQTTRALEVGWCRDLDISPDGRTIAVAVTSEGIRFVDPTTGQEQAPSGK